MELDWGRSLSNELNVEDQKDITGLTTGVGLDLGLRWNERVNE